MFIFAGEAANHGSVNLALHCVDDSASNRFPNMAFLDYSRSLLFYQHPMNREIS